MSAWPDAFYLVRGCPAQKPILITEGQLAIYDDGHTEIKRYFLEKDGPLPETFGDHVQACKDKITESEEALIKLVEDNVDRCSPATIGYAKWLKCRIQSQAAIRRRGAAWLT
jgi:hypothetical protein